MKLDVLFVDNHLLVINKPPGMLSQADRTGDADALTLGRAFIKGRYNKPGNVFLGLVHRLDRPVSGVMLMARTSKAASRLSEQFRGNLPHKHYIVLVQGTCTGEGVMQDFLVKERETVRVVDERYPGARYAELEWWCLGCRDGLSLIAVRLKTGRAHQIRVQLAARGFPVLGDLRYGAHRAFDGKNMALHCFLLGVTHPTTREPLQWTAEPPVAWRGYFDSEIIRYIKKESAAVSAQQTVCADRDEDRELM